MVRKRRTSKPASQQQAETHQFPAPNNQNLTHYTSTPQQQGGAQQPPSQQYHGGHRGYEHAPSGQGVGQSSAEQSWPPLSELHQATFDRNQASSSSPRPTMIEQIERLSIKEEPPTSQAVVPASSKSMRCPLRPGKGIRGEKTLVKANHFFVELHDKDLHHYDVSITPEVTSRSVNRAVMRELVNMFKETGLGGRLPAYDGRKNLYTAGALPVSPIEFEVTLVDENDGIGRERRPRNFKIVIKLAAKINLRHLGLFLDGQQADFPQQALQALDIVLRQLPISKYILAGRSFYSLNPGGQRPLGEGLESWPGFYQSVRRTQMGLSLNIDKSFTAFMKPLPVIQFVRQLLSREHSDGLAIPLSDYDLVKIKKALKGVKVEATHRGNMRQKYRICGLTQQATSELTFSVGEGLPSKSVVQYFKETYGLTINQTNWPCLQAGNDQKPIYLPMEFYKIVKGQRYWKRLNQNQITALLKVAAQLPKERERNIIETVRYNAYGEDPYAREFGIKISDKLTIVEARVLSPPLLKYHEDGEEKDCRPSVGKWNMRKKKMVDGGNVKNWICINFALAQNIQDNPTGKFCSQLAEMCQTSGMEFSLQPVAPPKFAQPEKVERELSTLAKEHKNLDLLIVILPNNNGSLYGDLKRICETKIGLVSQCCLVKHVLNLNDQYLANVALKINVKVGGRNTVLVDAISKRIPLVSDRPTIIFGADVTHPHAGEDSSPSIAAVVASQDWPEITKYAGLFSAQAHGQECIQDLYKPQQEDVHGGPGGMIRELLLSFQSATTRLPERIIFYRDGVGEGQFYEVLFSELEAIRKACTSIMPTYKPPVTFVVVQKRHHTRLFPYYEQQNSHNRSGNILPGTVVDSKICHPTEFDFYLCSHAGIQGTSRPTHYHVLWDDNNFSADQLQTLTNNLCYTYARCTRSVSIVPPAYYAHHAASRARLYMEPRTSDTGSMARAAAGRGAGGRNMRAPGVDVVRPLPAVKDNVKRVMFYC